MISDSDRSERETAPIAAMLREAIPAVYLNDKKGSLIEAPVPSEGGEGR